jgi:hypothetical protein
VGSLILFDNYSVIMKLNMFWFSKKKSPEEVALSCILTQELSSGGYRFLRCKVMEGGDVAIESLGSLQDSLVDSSVDLDIRHVLDSRYQYGATYSPEANIADIHYELMKHIPGVAYSVVSSGPIGGQYHSWVGVESDTVSKIQKTYPKAVVDSGYTGLAKAFDLNNIPFVYCSVDRYESVIAYIQGSVVYGHEVIPVGVSNMTRVVVDTLNCPQDMASNIVRKYGVQSTHYDRALQRKIMGALDPLLASLSHFMMGLSHGTYRPKVIPAAPECVVFGGLGTEIPGLTHLVELAINVVAHEDLQRKLTSQILALKDGPRKDQLPRYYPLLGLLQNIGSYSSMK